MAEYDVVVAGAGHHGLIVAGYLGKAGLNVCVVEARDFVGGGVVTREVTQPGFKHDLASITHLWITFNPLIRNDELGLVSKYGLRYIPPPDIQLAVVFPDDRALIFYRDLDKTCASIEKFSKKDAEAYPRFYKWSAELMEILLAGAFSPPPLFGALMSMLEQSEQGVELLRATLMSAVDIVNEWFESEELKIAITRWATEMRVSPQEAGTGAVMLFIVPYLQKYGGSVPEGGSGAISQSLERCIRDLGGTIMTSSPIRSIKVENGQAKGVILETGEEIIAKRAVVSNLNVKQLFLQMVSEEKLPSSFVRQVRRLIPARFQHFLQALALNEPPHYEAEADVSRAYIVQFALEWDDYLKAFDDLSRGIPTTSHPFVACFTLFDPSRAPEGKHTLYLHHFAPFYLRGGAARWGEVRQEVADAILKTLQDHTTNMGAENILGRWICSPLDFAKWNPTWIEGDPSHIGMFLHQNLSNRPLPGWAQYRTPIDRLYLCGPSTHPGTAVTGGGRAPAQVILADLGIDFEKVIG